MTEYIEPLAARIEISKSKTTYNSNHKDCWGRQIWNVMLVAGDKIFHLGEVIEYNDYSYRLLNKLPWSFSSRLKAAQKRLLERYKLFKELQGPIFVKHG